ncbi:MAG: DciA family protein [Thermoleophilaceae bacterium]
MSRRQGPRQLGPALEAVVASAAPQTLLARVQGAWAEAAGAAIAAQAQPVSERGGVVTVECSAAVWAQEVGLLAPRLCERLCEALGDTAEVQSLRVRAGGPARRS